MFNVGFTLEHTVLLETKHGRVGSMLSCRLEGLWFESRHGTEKCLKHFFLFLFEVSIHDLWSLLTSLYIYTCLGASSINLVDKDSGDPAPVTFICITIHGPALDQHFISAIYKRLSIYLCMFSTVLIKPSGQNFYHQKTHCLILRAFLCKLHKKI